MNRCPCEASPTLCCATGVGYFVKCKNCGLTTWPAVYETREAAIARWNVLQVEAKKELDLAYPRAGFGPQGINTNGEDV